MHLASYSALLAAASIVAVLDGEVAESEASAFYESLYRHSYTRMLAMVARMYDQYQGRAGYFWLAQKLTGTPAEQAITPNAAFVEIVGGISDLYDAQHGRGPAEAPATADEDNLGLVEILPRDLYDTDSQLRLVTSPRLGLRREQADTARVRPPRPAADADLTTSR